MLSTTHLGSSASFAHWRALRRSWIAGDTRFLTWAGQVRAAVVSACWTDAVQFSILYNRKFPLCLLFRAYCTHTCGCYSSVASRTVHRIPCGIATGFDDLHRFQPSWSDHRVFWSDYFAPNLIGDMNGWPLYHKFQNLARDDQEGWCWSEIFKHHL